MELFVPLIEDEPRGRARAYMARERKGQTLQDGSRERGIPPFSGGRARIDTRKSQGVELRFFGGLSLEEVADVIYVSIETVKRNWRLARLWLSRALQAEAQPPAPGRSGR